MTAEVRALCLANRDEAIAGIAHSTGNTHGADASYHGIIHRFKLRLRDICRQRLRFNVKSQGSYRLQMSDIAGCCELTLEKICEDEEEQKHLHRAMEKVGWSTDDSGELQYDLTKDKELAEGLENAIADAKEEVDELKEKVKAATAAEKKALQSKHKAEKELRVSRDQLAEVKAAEADLEAGLTKANGDVARALKSLRSMTALKPFVYSRQDAPPRVALRTISKAELGDNGVAMGDLGRQECWL
eukprot:jgi/Tetstr1/434222/TSEL_023333.t1